MALWGEKFTDRDCEAYAHALMDVLQRLADLDHMKSYDPLTIERSAKRCVAHSYIFDLWDGGRHHEWDGDPEVLKEAMLAETCAWLKQAIIESSGRTQPRPRRRGAR